MGCEVNYVDPLDPAPKSAERVSKPSLIKRKPVSKKRALDLGTRRGMYTPLKSSKTRAAPAWISPQECVGLPSNSAIKVVGQTDRSSRGRTPLRTSDSVNRSWKQVVMGEHAPKGQYWGGGGVASTTH